MRKRFIRIGAAGMLLAVLFAWDSDSVNARPADRPIKLLVGKSSQQPLTVTLSSQQVHVGESIWLTVSGGTQPYVLIAVENKIQVTSRGKNTYQISGLIVGDSGLTIGDATNNSITKVITVLPQR